MLGWMLIFIFMSLTSVIAGTADSAGFTPGATAGLVFALLLVISALTRALRGQA